jgi:hypothetical protein
MANPIAPMITPMLPESWPAVCEIYSQGIATGTATFETEPPDWEKWDKGHRKDRRLLAVESIAGDLANRLNLLPDLRFDLGSDKFCVLGWAAASPVSSRAVYSGVAEVSVYVLQRREAAARARRCFGRSRNNLSCTGSGPYRPAFFPRTLPALRCTRLTASEKSGLGGASGSCGMFGKMCCCWSAVV